MGNFLYTISVKKDGPICVLFNFVVLAFLGMVLRYMHCFSIPSINYQFLLHSHSHFAFSGWMFLAIILLFFYHFNKEGDLFEKQLNQIFTLTLLVSFGMLLSFFLTGYKTVSIILSTAFIFISYWFVFVFFKSKALNQSINSPVSVLLKGALFFLVISSLGPFSLGYLKGTGIKDLSLQQNGIYFYLHFQLNGFMQLALLGFLLKSYFKPMPNFNKKAVLWAKLLVISTMPLYAMFILWEKPTLWVYVLAFISAAVHLIAWLMLLYHVKANLKPLSFLAKAAILAVGLQFLFQILVAIPIIGNWAFGSRNLIIGYVHLLTLGSLSPIIIDLFARNRLIKTSIKLNQAFVAVTVVYLVLLFGFPFLASFKIFIPNLEFYLLATNLLFPIIGLAYFINIISYKKKCNSLRENHIVLSNNI